MAISWKVEILGVGESTYVSNGIRLPDAEQAERYGSDLMSRWWGADKMRVAPSDDLPNHTADEYGRLTQLNPPFSVVEIMQVLDQCPDVSAEMQSQIFKRLKALEHVIAEANYINETVTNGNDFAIQTMNLVSKAKKVLQNTANLPLEWKE